MDQNFQSFLTEKCVDCPEACDHTCHFQTFRSPRLSLSLFPSLVCCPDPSTPIASRADRRNSVNSNAMSPCRLSFRFLRSNSTNYRALHFTPSKLFSSQGSHLESVGPMASQLRSRSVIRLRGPDTVKFLQGLLTNDVRRFEEPVGEGGSYLPTPNVPVAASPPMYASMLTPQGRFLYDFFLYRPSRPDEKLNRNGSGPGQKPEEFELFADIDASVGDELLQSLKKYRLRSKVDIENVGEEFSCWQQYGGKRSEISSSTVEPDAAAVGWGCTADLSAMSSSQGTDDGWRWFKDPRLDCLGFRGIFPSNSTPPLVEADKEIDEENFLLWRLEKGVAEGSTEIPKGEAIPLEYNLEGLNAISFDKGCYVGQELIARTHHRGVIRKRLLPLKFVNDNGKELEQRVPPGSVVVDAASGKKVGTVTAALGSRGLAVLRLEEAFKGSGALAVQGSKMFKVEAIRPDWWPAVWFLDHQEDSALA
ncbi:hypothetical protein Nepgr_011336 [Nepenthes gracilis]|uniref:CAF17 C-terminal domain-containing protein n=1 Tax=Nepenthes gracilis TaxID=150966 RepID=A0AAD3XM84_NEPGR|nr:hypothetical protein Nepgr_011336 [Nepenthes gracilis]